MLVLANLSAKRNAINMLHSRLKLLLSYLSALPVGPDGQPNHEILRALWSLTNTRLPLLTPANAEAFRQEQLAEESDVNLVALLGTVTKSLEEVRSVGRKFAGAEQVARSNQKQVRAEDLSWTAPPQPSGKRGSTGGGGGGGIGFSGFA